jgi:hypothetical protein
MESTLADNRQMFNVSQIAYSTAIENLTNGQFGIFAEGSTTSVASGVDFSTLPDSFNLIGKVGNKLYRSFTTIEKAKMRNQLSKAYVAPVSNMWQAIIEHCNCIKGFTLNIHVDDMCRIQDEGLTWAHKDFVVDVQPKELLCLCSCDGKFPTYENNVITKLLVEKVIAMKSPYYNSFASIDVTDLVTYDDLDAIEAIVDPELGDLVINGDTDELLVWNGTAWVVVGTSDGVITELTIFVSVFQPLNTDDNTDNDGPMLQFNIESAIFPTPDYKDLEENYCYPRGIKIIPSLTLNQGVGIPFVETQAMVFEQGAGYDMRAEEWSVMSYSYESNHYPTLSDNIASPNLRYQFENGVNYNVVNFEFFSPNTLANDGRDRLFGVTIGATTATPALFTALESIFIP